MLTPPPTARKKVLIFPGGTEIGLEINKALRDCKDIELYSAGSAVPNHASYVFKRHFEVSDIRTDAWIDDLNAIIEREGIEYIYPAYDDIIVKAAENRDRLKAIVVAPNVEACVITRSKKRTYEKLAGLFPVPELFEKIEDVREWPVFVKPDKGQGAQGARLVETAAELTLRLEKDASLLTLEYLPGNEFTVDCFSDDSSAVLFASGRQRIRTRSGISMSSEIVHNPQWKEYADTISATLNLTGAWFFQMKEAADGSLKLLEVAPRISGTMATHRVLGVNFALLSIYQAGGMKVGVMPNSYPVRIDRALANRYFPYLSYGRAYIDFDDTIIINGKVNTALVALMYQMRNDGKKLTLITKCINDIREMLAHHSIAESLFEEIIHLTKLDQKIDHIDPSEAIFIDDSFAERKAVAEKHGIPTFDCSMLEMLIDDRV